MRILFVNDTINELGGIERYTSKMINLFAQDGHSVFALGRKIAIRNPRVTFIREKIPPTPRWLEMLTFAILGTYRAARIKRKFNIDVIMSNGSALFRADVIMAHSVHGAAIAAVNRAEEAEMPKWRAQARRIARAMRPENIIIMCIEKIAYRRGSKKIIAVSHGVKRELVGLYRIPENKIEVISNGVDLNRFKRDDIARQEIRNRLGVGQNETLIFFCGNEFKRKGLRFVLEALALAHHKEIKLVVAGKDDPAEYKKLAESFHIEQRVSFLGLIAESIEGYYSAADLFVFPTYYEAFALATLEAAAAGLPLLVTKVNGTEELVRDGQNGFFIERSGESIARKLDLILDNAMIQELSRNSEMIAAQFSLEEVYSRLQKLFGEI